MIVRQYIGIYLALFCTAGFCLPVGNLAFAGANGCTSVNMNGAGIWYPFSMRVDETGELEGVLPDLAKLIFKDIGVPVETGPYFPWKRLFIMMDNGQLDILAGAFHTEERKKEYGYSQPVLTEEVAVFVRKDLPVKPASLSELAGLRGLKPFGASYGEELDRIASEQLTIEAPAFDDFLTYMQLLIDGKADYFLMPRREGDAMIEELGAQDQVEPLPWPATVNTLHFLFSRSSPCILLLDEFDKSLSRYKMAGHIDGLVDSYRGKAGKQDWGTDP